MFNSWLPWTSCTYLGTQFQCVKLEEKKNLNIKAGERFGKSVQVDGKIEPVMNTKTQP